MKADIPTIIAGNHDTWDCWSAKRYVLKVALLVDSRKIVEKTELKMPAPRARQLRSSLLKFCYDTLFNAAHVVFVRG
ncbi:MAG: hypothetical protein V4584_15655 [Verrucomicrobiota bacterium]